MAAPDNKSSVSWQSKLVDSLHLDTEPVDVLFVTNQQSLPPQLIAQLELKDFLWDVVPVDTFLSEPFEPENIGTIILDTSDVLDSVKDHLCKTIRSMELASTAAILLNNCIDFPINNFKYAAVLESISIDEIMARIQTNLKFHDNVTVIAGDTLAEQGLCDDISEQLQMASQVQRDFLPKSLPNSDDFKWYVYFKPADWVSGDIYNVQRLDEDHIGFFIADAVGHSVPAALLTIFIKQALVMRETFGNKYKIYEPKDSIFWLNQRMCDQQLSGCCFATVCYCLLNIRTRVLTFARGGHPYPVLIRDSKPIQLQTKGALVGVFDENEFEQCTVQLQPGDKIFLYSDGAEEVVGSCDENQQFFFNDQFLKFAKLDIEQMVHLFGEYALQQQAVTKEIDDVTAVGLQVL